MVIEFRDGPATLDTWVFLDKSNVLGLPLTGDSYEYNGVLYKIVDRVWEWYSYGGGGVPRVIIYLKG